MRKKSRRPFPRRDGYTPEERGQARDDLQHARLLPCKSKGSPLDHEGLSVRGSRIVRRVKKDGVTLGILTETPLTSEEPGDSLETFLALGIVPQRSRRLDADAVRKILWRPHDGSFESFHKMRCLQRAALGVALLAPSQHPDLWERERENELITFARSEIKLRAFAQRFSRAVEALRARNYDATDRDEEIRRVHQQEPRLSQRKLAALFGVSQSTVSLALTGR